MTQGKNMHHRMSASRATLGALVALSLAATAGSALAQAKQAGKPAAEPASFTRAQAARGELIYYAKCGSCHGAELGGASAPALNAVELMPRWVGKSAADLLDKVRAMPPGLPEAVTDAQRVDLVAFLLSRTGAAPGAKEMAADMASLRRLPVVGEAQAKMLAAMAPKNRTTLRQDVSALIAGGPSQAELSAAGPQTTDWLMSEHDYAGQRYVDAKQITRANVKNLRPVCLYQPGDTYTFQANPVVYHGVMFITTRNSVIALDATNCEVRWRYDRVSRMPENYPLMMHRGVALKDGKLVYGTHDGFLVALDAGTGALLWETDATQPNQPGGGGFTASPTIFEDLVYLGPAGSETGAQGWIGAFKLSTGEPVWRFNTIPKDGEPGAETWPDKAARDNGGAATWGTRALDVATGRLYVPVANATPDFNSEVRPGDNLYGSTMVVLDARTGKLQWHFQVTPHDFADYDLTHATPMFDATIGGKARRLVTTVGKEGLLHVLDRDSHEVLYKVPVTTRLNNDISVTEAARRGVKICPGYIGGVQWNGPAYSPHASMLYVNAVDWCDIVKDPPESSRGWLTAIDARTGQIAWKYQSQRPLLAAVTATSADLLFTGELQGNFLALDAKNGDVLYRFNTGGRMNGGVMTYVAGGKQFVAAASGTANSFWKADPASSTLIIFALP